MPELSICILTRDNHETCKTTVSGILKGEQKGFELLVIDASEDTNSLAQFIGELKDDRIQHIPVTAKNRQEHWNQAVPECRGDWIAFISDADHIDPKTVEVIRRIKFESPKVDAIGWNKVDYDWPETRSEVRAVKISMETGAFSVDKNEMQKRFYGFEKEGLIPFNIYHGIVKRELVERIREKFGGVYFEHPVTSYEFGYKVLAEANELAFSERALSILSAQSEDMLSEATSSEDLQHKKSIFYQDIEVEDDLSKFPFESNWSPKILGVVALRWLVDKYGDDFYVEGWERNFVKRRVDECNSLHSNKYFDELSSSYKKAIANWCEGKFSVLFTPQFNRKLSAQRDIVGCFHGFLLLDKNAHGATNPAELYTALENFISPTSSLGIKVRETKRVA